MQLDLDCGQIFGVDFSWELSRGIAADFSTKRAAEFFSEIAEEFSGVADEWQVRHFAS